MRTRYFYSKSSDIIPIWRHKNGQMEYPQSSLNDRGWQRSNRRLDGSQKHDSTITDSGWRQITRDEARKRCPQAFRKA